MNPSGDKTMRTFPHPLLLNLIVRCLDGLSRAPNSSDDTGGTTTEVGEDPGEEPGEEPGGEPGEEPGEY